LDEESEEHVVLVGKKSHVIIDIGHPLHSYHDHKIYIFVVVLFEIEVFVVDGKVAVDMAFEEVAVVDDDNLELVARNYYSCALDYFARDGLVDETRARKLERVKVFLNVIMGKGCLSCNYRDHKIYIFEDLVAVVVVAVDIEGVLVVVYYNI